MLEKAERGEVAILLELAEKENFESARVTRKEMRHMMKAKKEDMTLTLEDLDVFCAIPAALRQIGFSAEKPF